MSTSEPKTGCNVSSSFNFTVGGLAVIAAGAIGWFLYHWLAGN